MYLNGYHYIPDTVHPIHAIALRQHKTQMRLCRQVVLSEKRSEQSE